MEQERYFDGPYIPLYPTLVVFIVFFSMLLISTNRWQEREKERDEAVALLNEELPKLQSRIEKLRADMVERENELQEQYDDMLQRPPEWPGDMENVVVASSQE